MTLGLARLLVKALIIIGSVWALPFSILIFIFYISWAWALGFIRFDGFAEFMVPVFCVVNKDSWYLSLWGSWWGMAAFNFMILRYPKEDPRMKFLTIKHELCHVYQSLILGVFAPFIYISCSVFIWIFIKSKHAYLDNPFERWARSYAGQKINFTKEEWNQGPKDRWPWW